MAYTFTDATLQALVDNIKSTIQKDALAQYAIMPTASAAFVDDIIQYLGADTEDYTRGSFYRCVAQDTDPITYVWEQVAASDIKEGSVALASLTQDLQSLINGKLSGSVDNSGNLILTTSDGGVQSAYTSISLDGDIQFTITHKDTSSGGDESTYGYIDLTSASGTWSNGNSIVFDTLPTDIEAEDIDAYIVFSLLSNQKVKAEYYTFGTPNYDIPSSWGSNYIAVDPMTTATYSTHISFDKIGRLENLATAQKTDLVSAINELAARITVLEN